MKNQTSTITSTIMTAREKTNQKKKKAKNIENIVIIIITKKRSIENIEDQVIQTILLHHLIPILKKKKKKPSNVSDQPQSRGPILERDDWMKPGQVPGLGQSLFHRSLNQVEPSSSSSSAAASSKSLELNPYLRDGGTGLPPDEEPAENLLAKTIGDGGASWKARAIQRAKEMAERDGRSFEEIYKERWGGDTSKELSTESSSNRSDERKLRYSKSDSSRPSSAMMKAPSFSSSSSSSSSISRGDDLRWSGNVSKKSQSVEQQTRNRSPSPPPPESSDLNKLTALAMKAEMMGDDEKLSEIRQQIEKLKKYQDYLSSKKKTEERKPLPPPVSSSSSSSASPRVYIQDVSESQQMRSQKYGTHLNSELEEMKSESKKDLNIESKRSTLASSSSNNNSDFTDLKSLKKTGELDLDDQFDEFEMEKSVEAPQKTNKKKASEESQADAERRRTQAQEKRESRIIDTCQFCFKSAAIKKHMIISLGEKTMLVLPPAGKLVEGHCMIVPIEHKTAFNVLDEDEFQEVDQFKRCLKDMFAREDKQVVFIETATSLKKQRHAAIECIPLPNSVAYDAPIIFKKSLQDADEEWAQHKKVIDTRVISGNHKGASTIAKTIPAGFPYFHVEFGLGGGFAHVIENEDKFPWYFGRQTLISILDLPPQSFAKLRQLTPLEEKQWVLRFVEKWSKFDWTQHLDGGDF